mmetsp:Transcript_70136/g.196548  ORF Transcript_70136/g.196548 Transcript_70136/m.196548 type:complete len:251 (-) Transcript_70136:337-1089(-)
MPPGQPTKPIATAALCAAPALMAWPSLRTCCSKRASASFCFFASSASVSPLRFGSSRSRFAFSSLRFFRLSSRSFSRSSSSAASFSRSSRSLFLHSSSLRNCCSSASFFRRSNASSTFFRSASSNARLLSSSFFCFSSSSRTPAFFFASNSRSCTTDWMILRFSACQTSGVLEPDLDLDLSQGSTTAALGCAFFGGGPSLPAGGGRRGQSFLPSMDRGTLFHTLLCASNVAITTRFAASTFEMRTGKCLC